MPYSLCGVCAVCVRYCAVSGCSRFGDVGDDIVRDGDAVGRGVERCVCVRCIANNPLHCLNTPIDIHPSQAHTTPTLHLSHPRHSANTHTTSYKHTSYIPIRMLDTYTSATAGLLPRGLGLGNGGGTLKAALIFAAYWRYAFSRSYRGFAVSLRLLSIFFISMQVLLFIAMILRSLLV